MGEKIDLNVLTKDIKKKDMKDFEKFEKDVESVGNMIQALATGKIKPEDIKFSEKERDLEKPKAKVFNRRVLDQGAATKTSLTNLNTESISQEVFMRIVEEDAERRSCERQERNLKSGNLKNQGNAAFREGKFERALNYYNQALDLRRDSSVLYCNRALTYIRLGLYTKACQDCDSAMKLKNSLKSRLLKSRALFELGDEEALKTCIDDTKEQFPDQKNFIDEYVGDWKSLR